VRRLQGLRAEQHMPKVRHADVEKPHWRQDRAGERLLDLDVLVDDVRVAGEAFLDNAVDVAAVEILIEPHALERRRRMQRSHRSERRCVTIEQRCRQP
jgi:hypothetical protein